VKVFSDFRELSADTTIDAVLMALPVHWHSVPSRMSSCGKHIYHEKPMAMSFGEAVRVREAVRRKGVVFQFGTQQRSDLKFRWACELALNGRLGKLKDIHVSVPGGKHGESLPEQPVPDYVDWDRWVGPAPATSFHEKKLERDNHENISNFSLGSLLLGIHHIDYRQWGNSTDGTGPAAHRRHRRFPTGGVRRHRAVERAVRVCQRGPVTFADGEDSSTAFFVSARPAGSRRSQHDLGTWTNSSCASAEQVRHDADQAARSARPRPQLHRCGQDQDPCDLQHRDGCSFRTRCVNSL
jgi:hypothetical protein